ncbi:MAG: RodZ domain-containing protein [Vicinamibacterales bacterium]
MSTATDRPSDCGRTLREARERRGVSLRQIANTTKISVSALEALERNDIAHLPGGIFSRAFVRSYASEVGVDPDEAVREFMAQFPPEPVAAGHPVTEPAGGGGEVESERRMATAFLWLIALSVPVAAVMLYLGIAGRRVDVSVPAEPPTIAQPSSDLPTAPAPPPEPVAPKATANAPTERLAVSLSATRPCWISVTVDGEKPVERVLQPGEQQAFEVRSDVVLTVGDAEALTMTLNGEEARPFGKPGQVTTIRFNLTNFKERLATR